MIVEAEFLNLLSIVAAASDELMRVRRQRQPASKDWREFHQTADGQAVVVVVFAVTLLEAYIQNYAARRLGDAFAEKHIERLDVLSKWLIVPRLVTLGEVRSDHPGIELLRDLIRARNAVVHTKSGGISTHERMQAFAKKARARTSSLALAALNAPHCLRKLGELLSALDDDEAFPKMLAQAFRSAERLRLGKGEV